MSFSGKFKGKVKLDKTVLEKLETELAKSKGSVVKVGVLAGKLDRGEGEEFNNADIGAVHELGSKEGGIPQRSFLEMPMIKQLPADVKKIKAEKFAKLIIEQGMETALKTLGVIGEQVVDKAFESRGFGTWEPNSEATIQQKGSDMPLIDTAKLRRSITSKVQMKGKQK